jgi:hypothetical protein
LSASGPCSRRDASQAGLTTPGSSSSPNATAGHYFYTVVDAATFEWLSKWLTNRPPLVPLQTLGPARNPAQRGAVR